MNRFLLDTSAILDILSGNESGKNARHLTENGQVITSVICYCEVLNKANLNKIVTAESFMKDLLVFPISLVDGELAKNFQIECRKTGNHVSTLDCLIAATAVNNNATVVTSDSDFDRINGVKKEIV